ncbi:MAG: hypothetical protein U0414_41775 [Polyangiaceae bacterium]
MAAIVAALAAPSVALADLGLPFPSPCDDKVDQQPCTLPGGGKGTCIRHKVGPKRVLVCTPPLDPSAYPPVPEPWASTVMSESERTIPSAAPSSTASPPAGGGACSCTIVEPNATPTPGLGLAAIAAISRLAARRARARALASFFPARLGADRPRK